MSKITEDPLNFRRVSNRTTYNKTGEERRTDLIKALTLDLSTPISNGYLTGNENNEYDKIFEATQSIIGLLGENSDYLKAIKTKFKYETLAEIKSDLLLPVTEAARSGNEQANLLLQTNRNPKFVVIDLDNYDQKMTNISLQNAQLLKDIGTAATLGDEDAYARAYSNFSSILSRGRINEEVIIKALDEIEGNASKLIRNKELSVNIVNEFPAAPSPLMSQDDIDRTSPSVSSRSHSGTISPLEIRDDGARTQRNEPFNFRHAQILAKQARNLGAKINQSYSQHKEDKITQDKKKRETGLNKSRKL